MDNKYPEFFRYSRSKGTGYGHGAKKRDPVKAWIETKNFLDSYTTYKVALPVEVTLKVENGEFDRGLYENIITVFGSPVETNDHWLRWRYDKGFNETINSFILNNCRYSPGYDYDMSIKLHFNFYWKQLTKELTIKYKEVFDCYFKLGGHGSFSIFIDNRLFIQPEFIVPVDSWEQFHSFTNDLIKNLPFNFSSKSFKSFYTKKFKNGNIKYVSLSEYRQIKS